MGGDMTAKVAPSVTSDARGAGGEPHLDVASATSGQSAARPRPCRGGCALVVVPFVAGMLQRQTALAVQRQWPSALLHRLGADDTESYARTLAGYWGQGRTLVVVEQDVVPPPGAIASLVHCPHLWCCVPYSVGARPLAGMLGCTKFAWSLTGAHAFGMAAALRHPADRSRWVGWRSVDTHLSAYLSGLGLVPHAHLPAATHLHDYPPRRQG